MQETIIVENIKCGGCARTIQNSLLKVSQVQNVKVAIEEGAVTIEGDNLQRDALVKTLASLGYPEQGTVSGFNSFKAKGTSFVSCAIGRISKG